MKIISHRGFWREPCERNSLAALARSVFSGFGTETDVRDLQGSLVISHDPPTVAASAWASVVDIFRNSGLPLAVNIKSDGLAPMLGEAFEGSSIDWFAFDMSGPEVFRYAHAGLPFFTRHSDIEAEPVLYGEARGVWLDSFGPTWYDEGVIERHLAAGKRVCLVSPELHGRNPEELWSKLHIRSDALMLCTDLPTEASARFRST